MPFPHNFLIFQIPIHFQLKENLTVEICFISLTKCNSKPTETREKRTQNTNMGVHHSAALPAVQTIRIETSDERGEATTNGGDIKLYLNVNPNTK